MQKKHLTVLISLAVLLAVLAGGWYFLDQRKAETAGQKAQAELALLGYGSLSDLDVLASNFPDGARYVESIKEALAVLDMPNVTEEDLVEAHLTIATSLNTLKNPDSAVKEYEEILKINSKHSIAFNNLAQIYLEKKDYARAEEFYKKLIEASPTWFQAYTDLADVYRAYIPEKKSEVKTIIEQGLKESPNRTSLTMYLAEFYEAEGDKKKAATYYQQVLKADSNNTDAKDGLVRVNKK